MFKKAMSVNVKILKCPKKGIIFKDMQTMTHQRQLFRGKNPPEFKCYAVILRIIIMISPFFETKKHPYTMFTGLRSCPSSILH